MALQKPLTNVAAFIDGETEAQKLIYTLADEIVSADIPKIESGIDANRWEKVYESDGFKWVTYNKSLTPNVVGMHKHIDGKKYEVFQLPDWTGTKLVTTDLAMDDDGYLWEVHQYYWDAVIEGAPDPVRADIGKNKGNYRTGRKIQIKQFSYTNAQTNETIFVDVPGSLITVVEDATTPDGYRAYLVRQVISKLDGSTEPSNEWNQFELVTEMPSDWAYAIRSIVGGSFTITIRGISVRTYSVIQLGVQSHPTLMSRINSCTSSLSFCTKQTRLTMYLLVLP
ncbi:hypothetical protein RE628_17690 [Paenibacillus sp. D2_2]|uniref:hypothetical protein n=1 Tax=Paenibacillus sp. D2_2 TaxID=3073092 RepID=UPI0028159C11|nr:hypothetical protein [Paenibacillus sp. D2_2]WMT39285.1 hypothetical protein RE628_17690 [Paenibacillus sp. D2_2]